MTKHWSGEFDPCCESCGRSPEEIPGKVTPEKLEEFGWIHSGFDWYCSFCDAVGIEEGENLLWDDAEEDDE